MNKLVFQNTSEICVATNRFVNVPIILRFEDVDLISVVKSESIGYTTEIPIYHEDGTYLTKIKGTRMYETELAKKAGVEIITRPYHWICKMGNRTLYEIRQDKGSFLLQAELYATEGYFVKSTDCDLNSFKLDLNGDSLQLGDLVLRENTFNGCQIGILCHKDGNIEIGVFN